MSTIKPMGLDTRSAEYKAEYYRLNREQILESATQKIVCDKCNKLVCKSYLKKHQSSHLCHAIINNKESDELIDFLKRKLLKRVDESCNPVLIKIYDAIKTA